MSEDRNAAAAARVLAQDPGLPEHLGSDPQIAEFDLERLELETVAGMTRREKRLAWTLGVSGAVAGLSLATGIGAIILLLFGAWPIVVGWGLFALLG